MKNIYYVFMIFIGLNAYQIINTAGQDYYKKAEANAQLQKSLQDKRRGLGDQRQLSDPYEYGYGQQAEMNVEMPPMAEEEVPMPMDDGERDYTEEEK